MTQRRLMKQKSIIERSSKYNICNSKYDVLKDSDALVLLTEWKEFRSPDFEK